MEAQVADWIMNTEVQDFQWSDVGLVDPETETFDWSNWTESQVVVPTDWTQDLDWLDWTQAMTPTRFVDYFGEELLMA